MSDFLDCIDTKNDEGKIDDDRYEAAKDLYRDLAEKHDGNPDYDDVVDKEISEKMTQLIDDGITEEEYRALNDAEAINELLNDLDSVNIYNDEIENLKEAALAKASRSLNNKAGLKSVTKKQKALKQRYYSYINSFIKKVNNEIDSDEEMELLGNKLLRAYYGEDVDEFHNKVADEMRKLFDQIRKEYQLKGGTLNEIEEYFTNPVHDPELMHTVEYNGLTGKAGWVEFMRTGGKNNQSLLDRTKMLDDETGEMLTDEELFGKQEDPEDFGLLGEVYDNIVKNKKDELGEIRQKPFHKKRAKRRVLHLDGAEAWTRYNKKYGEGSGPLNAIQKYVEGMSRDIASMDVFGSRPERSRRIIEDYVKEQAEKIAEKEGRNLSDVQDDIKGFLENRFRDQWDMYMNSNNVSPSPTITSIKQLTTSAVIGTASVDAMLGDMAQSTFSKWFNGLPLAREIKARLKNYFKEPITQTARKLGIWDGMTNQEVMHQKSLEAGVVADAIISESVGKGRMLEEGEGHWATKWLSEKAVKWSGLNGITRINRMAHNIEYGINMARMANNVKWENIDEAGSILGRSEGFKEMLERFRIGEKEWKVLKKMDFKEEEFKNFGGTVEWFRPNDMVDDELVKKINQSDLEFEVTKRELREMSDKMRELIHVEQGHSVPSINNRARGIADRFFGSVPVAGQIANHFKSFPITSFVNNFSRLYTADTFGSFAKTATAMAMITAPLGAISVQTREVLKGNDPMEMTDVGFWPKAMARGGFMPIMSEILVSGRQNSFSAFNNQVAGMVGGPTYDFTDDMIDIGYDAAVRGVGNKALGGKWEAEVGPKVADFLRKWTPGQNMWYARLALHRIIFDTMETLADPEAQQNFRRSINRQVREQDQGAYAPPGSGLSFLYEGDGPDYTDIIGGEDDQVVDE